MKQPATRSLRLFVGLVSSVVAACSGAGEDGLVTVGVRPTDRVTTSGNAGGLSIPGIDVMNDVLDGGGKPTRGTAESGGSGASAGTLAVAGAGTSASGGGGATAPPAATSAGAGAAGSGAAGASGSLGMDEDECGVIPAEPAGKVISDRVSGAGLIEYDVEPSNAFIRLRTTLAVPVEPAPNGQVFLWPGLQPTASAANLQPIGNGALMSVLAWGPLCAPDAAASYSTWWIAPMYSNVSTSDPQYAGCRRGKVVATEAKQRIDVDIQLDGANWIQRIVNRDTMEASEFGMDLKGQTQGRAFFAIGTQTSNKPTEDVIFTNTVLSMERSDPDACRPVSQGTSDFASEPRISNDGKHCCIDRIVLRASRVMATTTDPP